MSCAATAGPGSASLPGERGKVEALRKQLAAAGTDFDANITRATAVVEYAAEELEGVPEAFLAQESLRDGEGRYRVRAEIAWHYLAVMENARREDSRRRMEEARHGLAAGSNIGILGRMLRLRREIAGRLGYASWADYRTEVRMAGRGEAAAGFLKELSSGLEGKFRQELEGWRRMKAADSGDPGAAVRSWDWRYYARREVRERLDVDKEALRAWFPYEAVRDGLFSLAEQLFSLEAAPLAGAPSWAEGVEAWLVSDAGGPPLGVLYLDMFPREGKFRHFAQFGLIGGRRLSGGGYQCPCAALVCNFPPPSSGRPSLLSHDEVLTLFHEFGHALHSLLARSEFSEFSGTSVPRDFVEVPSQLMERWAWDQETLEGFAAHWREPGRPMEPGTIERLHRARLASVGTHYRRQAAFGLLDLAFHGPEAPADPLALSREILSRIFLPPPPGGAFVAGFGHLNGYDAGYYGYAWSDAIVADLDTVFGGSSRARRDPRAGAPPAGGDPGSGRLPRSSPVRRALPGPAPLPGSVPGVPRDRPLPPLPDAPARRGDGDARSIGAVPGCPSTAARLFCPPRASAACAGRAFPVRFPARGGVPSGSRPDRFGRGGRIPVGWGPLERARPAHVRSGRGLPLPILPSWGPVRGQSQVVEHPGHHRVRQLGNGGRAGVEGGAGRDQRGPGQEQLLHVSDVDQAVGRLSGNQDQLPALLEHHVGRP